MKLSQLTNSELGTLRARDLILEYNAEMNKVSSAMSLIMADTCDRALEQGDKDLAKFFFALAVKS